MLTQDQIDSFHREGYLIMRGVYQGEELKKLQAAIDTVQAQGEAKQGEFHLYTIGPDGNEVYWRSENAWKRDAIFRAVTVNPELLENIGQCVGQPFFPWNDSLVIKLARRGGAVTWHQDPPYMGANEAETFEVPNFTTDIYLDHSGPDNGAVYAIHGHHLVGGVQLGDKSEAELFEQHGAIPLEMEAGDVLFHCLSTPHGSRPNTSDTQRRIFYIHYLADEVFRKHYYHPDAEHWSNAKPGWGDAKKTQIEGMIADRKAFGWETPDADPHLAFGDGGFDFVDGPKTPPRYWGELSAKISPEDRARMKALKG